MESIGIIVATIIAIAWYLNSKKKGLAKEGVVLEMKQKTQEIEIIKQKEELKDIPEQEKNKTPDNVIDFWNKKK